MALTPEQQIENHKWARKSISNQPKFNGVVEHAIMTHHVSRKFIPNILENNVTITNVTSNDSPQQNTVMKQPNQSVKRKVDLLHQIRNKKPNFSSMKGTQKNL